MPDMWMPGAVREPQPGGVTLNRSLPPRATWHITWDKVTGGVQPAFENVSGYLKRAGYCPHLMWDPFTGRIVQYYPADVGGRALNAWNEDGAAHVQIEVYFSPGVTHDGTSYQTVVDTPCNGWAELLTWLDTLGIPRVWPMGAPQWQGNSRDADVWNISAGHYGHSNVPQNTHTDPGPMPGLTIQEDDMFTIEDKEWLGDKIYKILQDPAVLETQRGAILNNETLRNIQGTVLPILTSQAGQLAGLQETVKQLSKATGAAIDLAAIEAASKRGTERALAAGVKVDATVTVAGGTK